jgi:hypothetical protein
MTMGELYGKVKTADGDEMQVRASERRPGTIALLLPSYPPGPLRLDALGAVAMMAALAEFVRAEGLPVAEYRVPGEKK